MSGHSMILARLIDGDIAIVDRFLTPVDGDVVVVDIDGERSFKVRCRQGPQVTLHFANPRFPGFQLAPRRLGLGPARHVRRCQSVPPRHARGLMRWNAPMRYPTATAFNAPGSPSSKAGSPGHQPWSPPPTQAVAAHEFATIMRAGRRRLARADDLVVDDVRMPRLQRHGTRARKMRCSRARSAIGRRCG